MKVFLACFIVLVATRDMFGQGTMGSISWKVYLQGRKVGYVYLLDPSCDPNGDREKVTGPGYFAQLWYSPEAEASEDSLRPFPGLEVIRFESRGFMLLPGLIGVSGTTGGDIISLQFRAWDNRNFTIMSWEEAIKDPSVPRGTSTLMPHFRLGGVSAEGIPIIAGSLVQPEFTICAVPEPSSLALTIPGLLALAFLTRHRRPLKQV